MSSTPPHDYESLDFVDFLAAVSIFLFASIGIASNTFILYIFYIDKLQRTSFNIICIARAISNIYVLLTTFILVFFVVAVIGSSPYIPEYETINVGISINCYILNEYLSVYVALNRFVAIYFPSCYPKVFGFRVTMYFVVIGYTLGIGQYFFAVPQSLAKDCFNLFNPQILAWEETASPKCVSREVDFVIIFFVFLFSFVTVLNLATLAKILWFYNKIAETNHDIPANIKMKKNIVLFVQTIFQDLLYPIDIWFTFQLSLLSTNRLWTFISRTFVWLSIHTLDGVIMMIFSERVTLIRPHSFFNST